MAVSPITWMSDANYVAGTDRVPVRTLGQDDFLKLVVAQMTNQDPLNPKQDTEFIAQMAQFSTLEQSKSMQQDIAALRRDQEFLQAHAALGRDVVLQDEQGALVRGTVSAIAIEEGTPQLIVNDRAYPLSALLSVAPAADTK